MASMAVTQHYGLLVRSARTGILLAPRRTLTYTAARRAQEDNSSKDVSDKSGQTSSSPLSSIKNFFFGKRKSSASAVKPTITRREAAPLKREGSLSADSIFAEDDASPKLITTGRTPKTRRPAEPAAATPEGGAAEAEELADPLEERDRLSMQPVLDPRPAARSRWEKRMIVREIRRRGRLTKTEQILRTERESLSKSHWFKTSLKKLGPLARQIAGKNIDEAILQMRFSKKKVAKDVMEHLQHAKNVAIVRTGMGLPDVPADANGETQSQTPVTQQPITITLKSGERKTITNPTSIYVAQAWVNRGPFGVDYDHRARGQINLLRPPHTSLSVVLKEEKTRVREWRDREAKALRQRKSQLWTQLPDRKVSQQNQYYSW